MKTVAWTVPAVFIALSMPILALAQVAIPSSEAPVAQSEELKVLRAQIATTQDYQDQFISMVQWSLGAVLAMALGLAAFNWYTSKVSYERDIQSLRQENRALHAELTALIRTETEAFAKRLVDGLSERQSAIQDALSKIMDKRVAEQSGEISELKRSVLELRFNLTEAEAEEATRDKRYAWAIYKFCELLQISVEQGSDYYQVGDILDAISKLLDNPAIALSADDVTQTVESLKRLPQRYQVAAQNLIPRINRAHK